MIICQSKKTMALSKYNEKRRFNETPEPEGKEEHGDGDKLRFVVQKHHASQLHYDFRLEMEGALKSWAVPKGPSINPTDKRLAMMVEDHPYSYREFEGHIPAGNYGAGTVIVWDEGTYHAKNDGSREENETALLEMLEAGRLDFFLEGKKLKGEWSLFRFRGSKNPKQWLLVKKEDEYASEKDITLQNKSVISGHTLEELEEEGKKKGVI